MRKTVDSWSPRSKECCMRIVPIDELNLNADYQLVNGGRGLPEVYALGRRTESQLSASSPCGPWQSRSRISTTIAHNSSS